MGEGECPESQVGGRVGDGAQAILYGMNGLVDEHLTELKLQGRGRERGEDRGRERERGKTRGERDGGKEGRCGGWREREMVTSDRLLGAVSHDMSG